MGYTKNISRNFVALSALQDGQIRSFLVEQASVFMSNRSQAVRLPKAVALPESVKRVDIVALGRARLIVPAGTAWESWFDGEGVSDDFMTTREQPPEQVRDGI